MAVLRIRDENEKFQSIPAIKGEPGKDGVRQYTAGKNIEITEDDVINCTVEGGGTVIIDSVPTQGSKHAVSSGGTFDALAQKADKGDIPTDVGDLENSAGYISNESDPVFKASAAYGISHQNILNWENKADLSDLPTELSQLKTNTTPFKELYTIANTSKVTLYTRAKFNSTSIGLSFNILNVTSYNTLLETLADNVLCTDIGKDFELSISRYDEDNNEIFDSITFDKLLSYMLDYNGTLTDGNTGVYFKLYDETGKEILARLEQYSIDSIYKYRVKVMPNNSAEDITFTGELSGFINIPLTRFLLFTEDSIIIRTLRRLDLV